MNFSEKFKSDFLKKIRWNKKVAPTKKTSELKLKIAYGILNQISKSVWAIKFLIEHLILKVAIKMFDKCGLDEEKQLRLRREIDSMKLLKHENIIRLYEVKTKEISILPFLQYNLKNK